MSLRPALRLLPFAAGLALAATGFSQLRTAGSLRHSQNPFALQGSAYGKLLARLSETTIDRVWHLGVEQIVPHYMTGHKCGPHCNHHHEEGGEEEEFVYHVADHEGDPAETEHEHGAGGPAGPASPLASGKQWIQDRVIAQHHRTNPKSLNQAHLATVYRDIEKMLLRSFKLDPTHYGAYDSYHLFLTTHDFGGTPEARDQAARVANTAIAAAFREEEDPEPWLTAAAAGMNLYLMATGPYTERGESIPVELLREYREKIGYCLSRFDELQARAEQSGNWERLSLERQMEISERSLFARRTFQQFDAMIARAESPAQPDETGPAVAGSAPAEAP